MTPLSQLIKEAKGHLSNGLWNPDELFLVLSRDRRGVHYNTIRRAIHIAKSENFASNARL